MQVQWIRQKTIKRVIYFMYNCRCWKCTYYCYFNIFFSFYYGGNHDIIRLHIYNISSKVFKNITVINYFTFLNFPEGKQGQVISPHFTDEVTGYQMTTLSMSLGQFQSTCQMFFPLDFHRVCPLGCFCCCWPPVTSPLVTAPATVTGKGSFLPQYKAEPTLQIVMKF